MPVALGKIRLQIKGLLSKASPQHSFSNLAVRVLYMLGYKCKGQELPHISHGALADTQDSNHSEEQWGVMNLP